MWHAYEVEQGSVPASSGIVIENVCDSQTQRIVFFLFFIFEKGLTIARINHIIINVLV